MPPLPRFSWDILASSSPGLPARRSMPASLPSRRSGSSPRPILRAFARPGGSGRACALVPRSGEIQWPPPRLSPSWPVAGSGLEVVLGLARCCSSPASLSMSGSNGGSRACRHRSVWDATSRPSKIKSARSNEGIRPGRRRIRFSQAAVPKPANSDPNGGLLAAVCTKKSLQHGAQETTPMPASAASSGDGTVAGNPGDVDAEEDRHQRALHAVEDRLHVTGLPPHGVLL